MLIGISINCATTKLNEIEFKCKLCIKEKIVKTRKGFTNTLKIIFFEFTILQNRRRIPLRLCRLSK